MISPPRVRLADGFLAAVTEHLAALPPERGGAILGFGGTAHLLVSDTFGEYSPASWLISEELSEAVGVLEALAKGTLMGTVHSHPRGIPDPSWADVMTTAKALKLNPHLDELLIAIVTEGTPREFDVALGDRHRMSVHVLRRRVGMSVARNRPVRAAVTVHPIAHHLGGAGLAPDFHVSVDEALEGRCTPAYPPMVRRADGRQVLVVPLPEDHRGLLFVDALHPVVSPLALRVDSHGGLLPQPSPWDPTQDAARQVQGLVRRLRLRPDPDQWSRVRSLVGSLADRRVLVAGAGSVGCRIAEDLVRCGVATLTILDPDTVSRPNLARSVYTSWDLDQPKVEVLAQRLRDINPAADIRACALALADADLEALLDGIDLVVMATDDMGEQAHLAHWAYARGVPQVACAMYRKGAAGEVVLVVPEADTPCWNCCVGADSRSGALRPDANYGLGGRLVGEAALGPAINLVSSVASQLAVGLLAGPRSLAGQGLGRLIAQRRTVGLVSTTPDWDFFPEAFGDLRHQHEPQSVWPTVQARDDCPICGPERELPLSREQGAEFVRQLRELADAARSDDAEAGQGDA